MQYRYPNFVLFFSGLVLISYLIFPGQFDMVAMYRNSYLYNQALTLLDRLEAQRPLDTRIDLERANVLYLAGRYDDSVNLLTEVTEREPENETAWRQLARSYRVLQQPREAMAAYERVIEVAPADSQALYLLDEYYRWFQLSDREALNLERMTERFPNDRDVWDRLYALNLRTGRVDQAITLLKDMASRFEDRLELELAAGQLLVQSGDAEAIDVLTEALASRPDRADIAEDLIDALIRFEEVDRAIAVYREYYATRRPRLEYLDGLADLYGAAEQPLRAAETLAEKLEVEDNVDIREAVASAFEDAGALPVALLHAQELVDRDPENPDVHDRLIRLLEAMGRPRELVVALERKADLWPSVRATWLSLADARGWVEDYAGEAEALTAYLERDPSNQTVRKRLVDAFSAAGQPEAALAELRLLAAALRGDRSLRETYYNVLVGLSSRDRRVSDAEQLLRFSGPSEVDRNGLLLADTYLGNGLREAAVQRYEQIAGTAASPAFRALAARRLMEAGESDAALRAFREMLAQHPEVAAIHEGLADLLLERDPKAAIHHLDEAERLLPGRAETAYRRGVVLETAQDSVGAVRAFERFLTLSETQRREDAYFVRQRAHAIYRTGSPDRALSVLREARSRFPDDIDVVNDAAAILIDLKRYAEAMALLDGVAEGTRP